MTATATEATMTALRSVTQITTDALTIGDVVIFSRTPREVLGLIDTGRPAVFGTGTEWAIRLQDTTTGQITDMAVAASQRWTRA